MAERLREVLTASLSADELAALRGLFAAAWPVGFDDHDFAHALGTSRRSRHFRATGDGDTGRGRSPRPASPSVRGSSSAR